MDLQVVLPDESPEMRPTRLAELISAAEDLGYHTAWLPDHVLPPGQYGRTYGGVYEPLISLAYLAGRTDRIRLGTSVLVLALRNPFVLAKQAATIHAFSGGRFTLGVGIGWDRAEFDAVGADFTSRSSRTDEAIGLLRALFRGETSFDGEHYAFASGVFEPLPDGDRDIPIMVGGTSEPALARAARLADEWQGHRLDPGQFAEYARRLRALAGRDIRTGTRISWEGGRDALGAAVEQEHRFADAGADALAVWFGEPDGFDDRMAEFAAAIHDR